MAVVVSGAVVGLATNVASGDQHWPGPLDWVRQNAWLAVGVFLLAVAVGTVLMERLGQDAGAGDPPPPPLVPVPEWMVGREQAAQVARAVRERGHGTVGITTALQGAGGFGKTELARMVAADRTVRRAFRGRVYTVTVGRDVRGRAAVVSTVAETARLITRTTIDAGDPEVAGQQLGQLLDRRPRTLLVLDDVWTSEQLAPFLHRGSRCVLLVTTRIPNLLPNGTATVRVDAMSPAQARLVLTHDLPDLGAGTVEGLLDATGRWPLLLRIANRQIAAEIAAGVAPQSAAADLLAQLRAGGPAAVDPGDAPALDVSDPHQRSRSAAACLEAAIRLLPPGGRERFAELAVFAEDEVIPVSLVAGMWQTTAGLTPTQSRALVRELAGLSLLASLDAASSGSITLHDVVRDYLRHTLLTPAQLATLHGALVDTAAASLPPASALAASTPAPAAAWWTLPDGYLADHVVAHMVAAGRIADAEELAGDIRWVEARLDQRGPTAPWTDLTHVPTPRAERMARTLAQTAHLLHPTNPPDALPTVLHSRLQDLPDWHDQVTARQHQLAGPRLVNAWQLPDLPHPALQRTLTGHTQRVPAVAISSCGRWLASGSHDLSVRLWDRVTGTCMATLTGHTGLVSAVAISPNGSWLATADDHSVRLWDRATGTCTAILTGHTQTLTAVAISSCGSWLASAGRDNTVRLWDRATGTCTAILTGHTASVTAVAISPDGTWLATASEDFSGRLWDRATGICTVALTGHTEWVCAVAISPDGTWLATASDDNTVRLWDRATGTCTSTLNGHGDEVYAIAIAADGTWLASAGSDRSVRLWDRATGTCTGILTGHTDWVRAVAISPDGTWLATAGDDNTVRLWDQATTAAPDLATPTAVAISPDGTWLATTGYDSRVRLWDRTTGTCTATLTSPADWVTAVVISPDGTWLATTDNDSCVRLWDRTTGTCTATLTGHTSSVDAVAISPDGTWLATASHDDTVRLWDRATGTCTGILPGHTDWVHAVAISPDGTWLASASADDTVRLWDRAAGTRMATLTGHTNWVRTVAISPDGSWLATAGDDNTVRLWDRVSRTCTAILTGHAHTVNAVAISPDGSWLATASRDATVRIWGLPDGSARTLMRTSTALAVCAWAPDNRHLAVGGRGGLYLYEFRP